MSSYTGIEQIDAFIDLMKSLGYEFVGDFGRDRLDLGKVEKCEVVTGTGFAMGTCACNAELNVNLYESDVVDLALIVFVEGINWVNPLDATCRGEGIVFELIVETEATREVIERIAIPPCSIEA